jgi:lipopolysaccharide export system protein LptC
MSFLLSRRRQDRITAFFPLVAVAFFAALTYWLDARVTASAVARQSAAKTAPDHFLQDFKIERTSKEGRIEQTIVGERATHFPTDNTTVIRTPRYESNVEGKAPLSVSAKQGVFFSDPKRKEDGVEQADFSGKVVATQGAFKDRDAIRYESETMTVFPKTQQGRTKDTTRTTSGDRVVTTEGIEIDAENQTGKTSRGFNLELTPKEKKP